MAEGLVFCSKLEDIETNIRIHHPYFMMFDSEDSDSLEFSVMDPWNPEDFLEISKTKVEFMTKINPFYTQIFRKVLFSRLGAVSPAGGSIQDSESKVVLINRKNTH